MNFSQISLNDKTDLSILRSRGLSLDNECDHFLITEDNLKLSKAGWGDGGIGYECPASQQVLCSLWDLGVVCWPFSHLSGADMHEVRF